MNLAIIGVIFYEQQTSAYANFRFIVSTFLLVILAASIYICSYVKIYLILVLAALSFCSPIVLEIYLMFEKRRERKKNIIEQQSKVDTFLAKFFK
jgi:general stress protein CsbA